VSRLARTLPPIALLLAVALLVAACQAQPAPEPTKAPAAPAQATKAPAAPAAPTAAPAAQPAPTAAPAAAPAANMAADQHLRVNLAGEPATIDPNLASWVAEHSVIDIVFETLFSFDLKTMELRPQVAREIPSTANGGISADGQTYTFRLGDSKWSDGKAVVAKDFEYSIRRMLDPTLAAEYASFYYDIVGAEAYNSSPETDAAKLAQLKSAVGVKALDEKTLEVKLVQPRATFPQVMALWPVAPLREDIVSKSPADRPSAWTEKPDTYIGNGPFRITEWVHQDHITFVPNENYAGPKPKLTKLTYLMVTDAQANYAAYLNGEREITNVPVALIEQVKNDPNLSKELQRGLRLTTFGYQFNNKVAPFDNVKVRQAFNMAFDREAMINQLRRGVGKPAYSWIPPGMPGYQAELGQQYKLNPAKAKELLAEAGYPNGQGMPKITMQYANSGNNPIYAQFMQEQYKANLGIEITLEPMEPKAFSQAVNREEYMIGWYGWGADYPDPDNWLPELFGTGAGNNHTAYSNPKLDDLMKRAISETDPQKRMQMWAEAQKIVVDDAPIIFVLHDENFFLAKPYVKDLVVSPMTGNQAIGFESYKQVWLEKR
jgi:oligopeptide transport system substrate-binding protein